MSAHLAVYTVVHPGVKGFVANWYESVANQTDPDFDLWISLDSLSRAEVTNWVGSELRARWVLAQPGNTPAELRSNAVHYLTENYPAIVFVDSDDILQESRVAAARAALETSDLAGCALRLVDQQGHELGQLFGLLPGVRAEQVLPQNNVFGLSNSAYRSNLLRRCLPIPAGVILVDWFLATRAWLMGARLAFDPVVRMDYRQHRANMARVRYPIGPEQVKQDTQLVSRHFAFVLASDRRHFLDDRLQELQTVASGVEAFSQRIIQQPRQLERYVEALNILNPPPLWWSSVAHPALQSMWQTKQTNQT